MKLISLMLMSAVLVIQGCMSIPEINAKMRQLEVAWELENQKLEDSYRVRALNVSKSQTMEILKKVFLNLGMPLNTYAKSSGVIETISVAPTPLTKAEWMEIRKIENPKIKKIAGTLFYLPENPDEYFLIVRAKVVGNDSVSVVRLDYELRSPEYAAMGVLATRRAPPMAVQLGSMKIWAGVNDELKALGEELRKRTEEDPDLI